MKVENILDMYFYLVAKRRHVKRSELALHAGVSPRSVSRYIDALTLAGVPVYSESGANGGYYIPDDYVLSEAALHPNEKARLITCVQAAKSGFNDDVCDRVLLKLRSLAHADLGKFALKSDTLVIDAAGWNAPVGDSPKFRVLARAVEEKRTVRMKYTDRYEYETERLMDPYCIVLKGGMWYVYSYCHARRDFRLFKLARIKDMTYTGTFFVRKESDVYAKLHGDFEQEDLVRFTIEFDNLIRPEIEEWLGTDSITDTGTKLRATAELFGGNVLLSKLLSFGSSITVTDPPALREELAVECKRMLNNYF